MRILFIGDIMGRPGRKALAAHLPGIISQWGPDLVIANGENLAGGRGISRKTAKEIFAMDVEILTGGNHIWDNREGMELLAVEERIVRPLNVHPDSPGQGFLKVSVNGFNVMVVNLLGRLFMPASSDCPFRTVDSVLASNRDSSIVIVDFHAEATSEKISMGWHLDGRVSAILGTHTHVQTADERILPNGTAYMTDVGMTGSFSSVIGVSRHEAVKRFVTGLPVAVTDPPLEELGVNCVVIDIENTTGRATSINRLWAGDRPATSA
ncbi:MAG: TIGR00282 family metallophosphoesterase [Candidatus Wallbacteria bacterium HGW-Wallbacteria-1]|jgi:hypothetical protein|uniref:TIGR00282 family metallophosphoesterase n=1 Tax=Candidatus Wallbacteria bacterium HGW-Wallbacteria-1 TaxID=2013854 RepID=A0A2N1PTT2_9BACT|nr:MAG: TIGR00282 family metallophosphoesterase [Candidatus Wallbacteria bacterium HGW-Wallbacteria-1]